MSGSPPDPLATIRRRLVEQGLGARPRGGVAEVVRHLGAVQAQEFAEAMWSLAERTNAGSGDEVEAAFARGDIVRTHLLRPTWHLVAAEDVRWLLRATRARVHALNRYMYGKVGLEPGVISRSHDVLARELAGGDALTRDEVAKRWAAAGIPAEGFLLAYLLMYAELEALICSGPRRGRQHTYALLDDRVAPSPLDALAGEEAVDELVLRYFVSHGPATVRDFRAWSSQTAAGTRAALERVGDRLERWEDAAGVSWYAARDAATADPDRLAGAFLIPQYDETVVAYQDLRVVLARRPPRPGLLQRAIVIDGRTVGSWRRTLSSRSAVVVADLFADLTGTQADALSAVAERFSRFAGLPATLETRPAT